MRSRLVPKSMKIETKVMLRKVMQKNRNHQKWIQKGTQTYSKINKNKIKKIMRKKRSRHIWYGGPLRSRSPFNFKANSSEDTLPKEKNEIRKDDIQVSEIQTGESDTNLSSPWAPSGHVRIYLAQGPPTPDPQQVFSPSSCTPCLFFLDIHMRNIGYSTHI